MRRAVILVLVSMLPICASTHSFAQSKTCSGQIKQPHPNPYSQYNFETDSLFDAANKFPDASLSPSSKFKYGTLTCVTNPDPTNFLYVHWLIPGPDGWVPPKGGSLPSIVRFTDESSPASQDGCLAYGNRGDTYFAKFHVLKEEMPRVQDEQNRGCRAVIANPKQQSSILKSIENFALRFVNYVPSDVKNPQKTMLKIEGDVGVKGGPYDYTSYMTYKVSRVEGSDGSIRDITLRPQFRSGAEQILPAFEKAVGPSLKVDSEGGIFVPVTGIKNPQLAYASYVIFDRNNAAVGAIGFPIYIPGAAR